MNTEFKGPIFVVGAPRTGTTLTMEILNRHPQIHLYNEVHYNERVVDVVGGFEQLDSDQLDNSIDILLDHCKRYHDPEDLLEEKKKLRTRVEQGEFTHPRVFATFLEMEAEAQGKSIWGDSSPQDVLYMEVLKQWYPEAKFIGVVRDPRAFLASYKNYYRKNISNYRNRFNPMTNSVLWRSYMNSLQKASSGHLSDSLMILHYEELVSSPSDSVKKIMTFLGLDFHEDMLHVGRQNSSYFSVKEDSNQSGISAGSVDRWRSELTNSDQWILNRVCGPTMVKMGYEPEKISLSLSDMKDLVKVGAQFPARLFNNLFRTGKPFTKEKLTRVFKSLR